MPRGSNPKVIVLTGAGASRPSGYPAMTGLAEQFWEQETVVRAETAALRLLSWLLFDNVVPPRKRAIHRDLEEALLALTDMMAESERLSVTAYRALLAVPLERLAGATRSLADVVDRTTGGQFSYASMSGHSGGFIDDPLATHVHLGGHTVSSARDAKPLTAADIGAQQRAVTVARAALRGILGYSSTMSESASLLFEDAKEFIVRMYQPSDSRVIAESTGPLVTVPLEFNGKRVDYFTTNYDLCPEIASSALRLTYKLGFSGRDDTLVWTGDFGNETGKHVRIYKLHGSVNWFLKEDAVTLLPAGAGYSEPTERALIYPIRDKAIAHGDPFSALFGHFRQALLTTQVCIVAGYSFRDDAIASMVASASHANPQLRFVVAGSPETIRGNEWLRGFESRFQFMEVRVGAPDFEDELRRSVSTALAR
jgi:hypothetical protein